MDSVEKLPERLEEPPKSKCCIYICEKVALDKSHDEYNWNVHPVKGSGVP